MPTVATPTPSRSAVTRTRGSGVVVIGVAVALAVAVLLIALFERGGSHGTARAVPAVRRIHAADPVPRDGRASGDAAVRGARVADARRARVRPRP